MLRGISPSAHDKFVKLAPPTKAATPVIHQADSAIAGQLAETQALLAQARAEIGRLRKLLAGPSIAGTARKILVEVAAEFGLTFHDMISCRRHRILVRARQKAMWRIKNECSHMSLPMIGKLMGDRDHTTILHGVRAYQAALDAGEAW